MSLKVVRLLTLSGALAAISPLGRLFRDVLGRVHQMMAARADELYYTVAEYALPMKALGAQRIPTPIYGESTP